MVTLHSSDPKHPVLLLLTPLETRDLIKLLEASTHRAQEIGVKNQR